MRAGRERAWGARASLPWPRASRSWPPRPGSCRRALPQRQTVNQAGAGAAWRLRRSGRAARTTSRSPPSSWPVGARRASPFCLRHAARHPVAARDVRHVRVRLLARRDNPRLLVVAPDPPPAGPVITSIRRYELPSCLDDAWNCALPRADKSPRKSRPSTRYRRGGSAAPVALVRGPLPRDGVFLLGPMPERLPSG